MDSEMVKGRPLTKDETKFLVEFIEGCQAITTKPTNATYNKLKTEQWKLLAQRFNATTTNYPRTPQQLRLKWENLKKNARKRSIKIRMNQIKTGGGSADYVPPDDMLDRVTSLLGSTVSGFTVPFGGDKVTGTFKDDSGGDGEDGISGDGLGMRDAQVSLVTESYDSHEIPISTETGTEAGVTDYHVLNVLDENMMMTPKKTKRVTFNTPREVRKKLKPDESRTTRNLAIIEYYSAKKKSLDLKLLNTRKGPVTALSAVTSSSIHTVMY